MKTLNLVLLLAICFLSSCYRQVFYVSPYNGNNESYHAMPLKADSIKSTTAVSGNLFVGAANTQGSDNVIAFNGSVYRTHQFGIFQAYYSGDLSLGNYNVTHLDSAGLDPAVNFRYVNSAAGSKFFYGYGAEGGINIVVPFHKGEWRALGIEGSTHQELGSYLDFRQKMPDSAATLIIRNSGFSTIGLYTEFLGSAVDGEVAYGLRFSIGRIIEPEYNNATIDYSEQITYTYWSLGYHLTYDKWTYYFTFNDSKKSQGVKLGAIYQLGKKHF
jgi:hypothetical protein